MADNNGFGLNPFSGAFMDWLEEPGYGTQAAYQAMVPQQSSPTQRQFFQNQFQPTMNEFLGQLGGQVLGGQAPTVSWVDFLKGSPTDNPFTRMRGLSPGMRGMGRQSTFAPRSRFLFNF
jgi:hypothetical protein